jgi:L-threonylcarbamoyladenylate synthase
MTTQNNTQKNVPVITHELAQKRLHAGDVGVIPTDTIYGIVASALLKDAVERVYALRERDLHKPCIILIHSVEDVYSFDVLENRELHTIFERYWPGPTSIIMPCPSSSFDYLHRGTFSLAFRVPADQQFRIFLKNSGPLIAPSANTAGQPSAQTVQEAYAYFEDRVDFYIDRGRCAGEPSEVIKLSEKGEVQVIRSRKK